MQLLIKQSFQQVTPAKVRAMIRYSRGKLFGTPGTALG